MNLHTVRGSDVNAPAADTASGELRETHVRVWKLAWPSLMTMLLQTVNSVMDVIFVGHLPNARQALAATGVGGGILFLMIAVAMGVTVGTTALVARFTGAGKHDDAIRATGQSFTLGLLLALLCGSLAYAFRAQMVGWMLDVEHNPEAAALCTQFLGVALLATPPLFLSNVLYAAFRAIGDTRTPLMVTGVAIAVHVVLNGVLIYGKLGLPALGVRGAGTAIVVSNVVGLLLICAALRRRSPLGAAFSRDHLLLRAEWAVRILRVGAPAALQALIRSLGMISFTSLLARSADGAAGVAALQIGLRAEALAFMPGFGYSIAASALVGQSLGARSPRRAETFAWAATWQAIGVMSVMAVVFYLFAGPFARLFTGDPAVQRLGVDYLRISALSEPFLGLGMVLTGALQGAGDTLRPTMITILTMWVLRLPLAQFLMFTQNLQTRGAWLAMAVTTVVGGLMTAAMFRRGKWKKVTV